MLGKVHVNRRHKNTERIHSVSGVLLCLSSAATRKCVRQVVNIFSSAILFRISHFPSSFLRFRLLTVSERCREISGSLRWGAPCVGREGAGGKSQRGVMNERIPRLSIHTECRKFSVCFGFYLVASASHRAPPRIHARLHVANVWLKLRELQKTSTKSAPPRDPTEWKVFNMRCDEE